MRVFVSVCGSALALSVVGCAGGYVDVGGYDAEYVAAPVGIEAYPHYVYGGEYVYDVNGRFYRHYNGRWVAYHHPPPEVARWHEAGHGRAEHQR